MTRYPVLYTPAPPAAPAPARRVRWVEFVLTGPPRDGDWPTYELHDITVADLVRHLGRLTGMDPALLWAQADSGQTLIFAGNPYSTRIVARLTGDVTARQINETLQVLDAVPDPAMAPDPAS